MNRSLIICDRLMYGALLAMVFFIPYSLALIEISQLTMIFAWGIKQFILFKGPFRQSTYPSSFKSVIGPLMWPLIAIAVLIVLTVPFSHYPSLSVKKFFSRFLQQIFLMYLITQIVHSRKRLYGILAMALFTYFFVTIDVLIQYTWGKSVVHHTSLIFGRVSGPMNHPNDLGTLLVTFLPVTLILLITSRAWVPSLLSISKLSGEGAMKAAIVWMAISFLLLVNALGLSASRGAWISFAVSMVILTILLKRHKLTVLIVLMLAMFFWVYGMHCLNTRIDMYNVPMTKGPELSPSLFNPFGLPSRYNLLELFFGPSGRGSYWETAASVIKHYPWFGCGYSAYIQTLKDLHVGHEEYPHNSLLQITAELGILGLLLYSWFFAVLSLRIRKVLLIVAGDRSLYLLGCGVSLGILAWFIHSLMDTAWDSYQLSVLWWFFIGILLSLALIKEGEHRVGRT